MIYLELLLGFLKVGCFAFGGGYGAIPLIRDVVLQYGWLSDEELTYLIAVSESTPGPIMVNLATFVGSEQGGILGAACATIGVVLPSFFIILLLTAILQNALKNKYVQRFLDGIKPSIIGIILATGMVMVVKNWFADTSLVIADLKAMIITILLAGLTIVYRLIAKKKIQPILLICVAAVLGVVIYGI